MRMNICFDFLVKSIIKYNRIMYYTGIKMLIELFQFYVNNDSQILLGS